MCFLILRCSSALIWARGCPPPCLADKITFVIIIMHAVRIPVNALLYHSLIYSQMTETWVPPTHTEQCLQCSNRRIEATDQASRWPRRATWRSTHEVLPTKTCSACGSLVRCEVPRSQTHSFMFSSLLSFVVACTNCFWNTKKLTEQLTLGVTGWTKCLLSPAAKATELVVQQWDDISSISSGWFPSMILCVLVPHICLWGIWHFKPLPFLLWNSFVLSLEKLKNLFFAASGWKLHLYKVKRVRTYMFVCLTYRFMTLFSAFQCVLLVLLDPHRSPSVWLFAP